MTMASPTRPDPAGAIGDDHAIARIATGMLARTLPKTEWTHAAHWAAALWILRHRPALATPEAMRAAISGYNLATGTANTDHGGYHHTITCASMRAAAAALAAHRADADLATVLAAILASPQGRTDWLLTYWHAETLWHRDARLGWVEPDRRSLPF